MPDLLMIRVERTQAFGYPLSPTPFPHYVRERGSIRLQARGKYKFYRAKNLPLMGMSLTNGLGEIDGF